MTWTCPTRNCRRADEHDAKGCVPGPDLETTYGRTTSRGEVLHGTARISVTRDSQGHLVLAVVEPVTVRLMCDVAAGVIGTERP